MPTKQTLPTNAATGVWHSTLLICARWCIVLALLAVLGGTLLFLPQKQVHAATNAAVQYADSYWNCTNPSCTSTVSAGTAQPNFECAEFVARALSMEGLVPGLNSGSSQSAYGNYHAQDGKTYDLLWVGWTTASKYSTGINGLYQYLIDNGIGSDIGNHPSEAVPGDVVIYHEGQGHTSLLVQTGSSPLVDAHNNARYHVGYTEGYSDLTIIHVYTSGNPAPPVSGTGSTSWPDVGEGSTGEDVVSIQLLLEARGYSLSIDGDFGPQTAATVEAFQSAAGLGVDGDVGPQTWPALIVTTSQGSTGPAVEALQRQLNVNGERVSVDSDFGPLTQQAVLNFQSSRGLSVDGSAGPQTWEHLIDRAPVTTATATWPDVSSGSTGEKVYSIQLFLEAHGYSLSIDGDFGPQTAATVKAFQAANGLSVDGDVGPQTWPVLVISTDQGSDGPAVEALQRQLDAHGYALAIDGSFGPLTNTAVRSYQSAHGLGVDGIAGPKTWQSLLTVGGSSTPPPPPSAPSGSTLWGFDTTDTITSSYLSSFVSARGEPSFIARYIDALTWSPMSASEAAFIHSQGIPIMVLDSSVTSNDTTYSTGVWMANRVITNAKALSIPLGVAIFADIENTSAVDSTFIEGWYDTITAAGYKAGYYNNPYTGSSEFDGAFCAAISSNAAIASQSFLWSDEPDIGWTTEANAPGFAPAHLYCSGQSVGNVFGWQYALSGGSFNVDSDEITTSIPLWH